MKRTHVSAASLVLSAVACTLSAPSAAAAGGPLAGTWISTDTDGSSQTLKIRGTGQRAYAVTYHDESATSACGGDPARISGPGFVEEDGFRHVGPVVCLPGGNVFTSRFAIEYRYDAANDTLTDDFGIVWHRAR